MMTLAIEAGDAATWGGTFVTLLVALYAIWQGRQQEKGQRDRDRLQTEAVELAHRQTEAAERRAYAVERMVERWISEQAEGAEDVTFSTQVHQVQAVAEEAPHVSAAHWTLSRKSKYTYVLRNDSSVTVTGVHVDPENIPTGRALPDDAVLRPGESAEFMMISTFGGPVPNEIWLRWDGAEQAVAIPVP